MKKFNIFILMFCLFIPWVFVACENTNKNSLKTPTNVSIANGVVSFDYDSSIDHYTISFDDDFQIIVDAKQNENVKITDNVVNYDANKILSVGETYSIKVKASAEGKNDSKFSKEIIYTHSPVATKPQNVRTNGTVLTWDLVENANYYIVRVVTPNETILYDLDGNIITNVTSSNIDKADLQEYSFNSNQFDFNTLLKTAGNYDFYVCAVIADGVNYSTSGYSAKTTYKHIVKLETPTVGTVANVNNELHLNIVIDNYTNAINIYCGNLNKQTELNGTDASISISSNMLDVNLNKYFADYINSNRIDITAPNLEFKVQACFASSNINENFYENSAISETKEYSNAQKLASPQNLQVSYNAEHNYSIATWAAQEDSLNGFKIYILSQSDTKVYNLDKSTRSFVIEEDFVAIYLQSIGKGNFQDSDFTSYPSGEQNLNVSLNYQTLTWTNVDSAYYVLINGNDLKILNTNSYTIDFNSLDKNNLDFQIAAISNTKRYKDFELGNFQLGTPYIRSGQGFGTESTNMYELSFTGSENAIGYKIRIRKADETDFITLTNIYTSTKIDLSQYFANELDNVDYVVQIKAIADKYSLFNTDSNWSHDIEVSHIQVLETPTFYSIDGTHATPISKELIGNTQHYILKFYGVTGASSYEVLIGGSKIIIPLNNLNALYEYDVTNYMTSAKQYIIKLRALKYDNAVNMRDSEYAIDESFVLYKQLDAVSNIQITPNDGVITLSFDQPNNAGSYRVRIVKYNDNSYGEYLNDANLPNPFVITSATNITQYLMLKGVYYIYITALPSYDYYTPSKEAESSFQKDYQSLSAPTNIAFNNVSADTYTLSWTGDENADYYKVKIIDPDNFDYQFNVYGLSSTNINKYISKQGTYTAYVYSMVNPTSSSAAQYSSSSFSQASMQHIYSKKKDFERAKISIYGSDYTHIVSNVQDLKNLLWYYYLYGINQETYSALYVEARDGENIRDSIVRLANEADTLSLFPFRSNPEWLEMLQNNESENILFTTLCKNLLSIYPNLNVLDSFNLIHSTGPVFKLYYENALNATKVETTENSTLISKDYGSKYVYLDNFSRRTSSTTFAIDTKEEQVVTTTEQLLQAVQFGKKPKFTSGSDLAREVYSNAREVLLSINSNEMTDLEKVTNIFNWLEYALNLNYAASSNIVAGNLQPLDITDYGLRKEFYLENLFEGLTNENNGNFDGEFYLGNRKATSELYSKAFALLCSIEGIDSIVVYGYNSSTNSNHTWNKVLLNINDSQIKTWYNVDLMNSDNRIYGNNINQNYEMASHIYFLTSDAFIQNKINLTENMDKISKQFATSHSANIIYNYYASSQISLTKDQILSVASGVGRDSTAFTYSNEYSSSLEYQYYAQTATGYGNLKNYILNQIMNAEYLRKLSNSNLTKFEFKFYWEDNGGSSILSNSIIQDVVIDAAQLYSIPIELVTEPDGTNYKIDDTSSNSSIVIVTLKSVI